MTGLELLKAPEATAGEIADIISAPCPPIIPAHCDGVSCRACWLAWLTGEPLKGKEPPDKRTAPDDAPAYEDAKVNIELIIDDTPSQTKYQRYATLRAIFRSPGQSVPQPIPIISEDTAAHGVEKVIFKKLSHKGENKRGQLTATLELWEYIPQTITAKSGSSSGSSSGSGKSGGGAASNLKADYKSYLSNERGKSPARDDADATAAMNKVTAMPY